MITKEMIERINTLSRRQRSSGLTPEEREEQNTLRQQYLSAVRKQIVDGLEGAGVRQKDGHGCSCGCTGKNRHHSFNGKKDTGK